MYQHPTLPTRTEPSTLTVRTLVRSGPDAGHRSVRHTRLRHRVVAAVAALAAAGTAYATASAATPNRQPITPNQCIRLNGGDYNACNVGNSGRGDLPYRRVANTPNDCIKLNRGDYNACNVANSGRGDLPYRPLEH
jgi:hypothetical protein